MGSPYCYLYEFVKDPVQPSDPCLQHLAGPAFELP